MVVDVLAPIDQSVDALSWRVYTLVFNTWSSSIFGVWAAPATPKTVPAGKDEAPDLL